MHKPTQKPLVKVLQAASGSHVKHMTNRTPASPLALTAIAAVLALSSTPVLAQETAAPDPAPVAAPAPAATTVDSPAPIVIPDTRSAPLEQASPTASMTSAIARAPRANMAAARAAPRQPSRSVAAAIAAPVATAVQPASIKASTVAPAVSTAASPGAVDVPQVTAAAPAAITAAPAQNDNITLELGLLGLIALGGAGAYGLARRGRHGAEPDAAYRDERVAEAPEVVPPVTSAALIAASPWVPALATAADSRAERRPPATSKTGTAIPAGPLPTGAALGALFERMATAAPDADNPFTATKRRRQRVRWLLKQHEYRSRNSDAKPFDFRSYGAASEPRRELVNA